MKLIIDSIFFIKTSNIVNAIITTIPELLTLWHIIPVYLKLFVEAPQVSENRAGHKCHRPSKL